MVKALTIDELYFVNADLVVDARSRFTGRLRSVWTANGRILLYCCNKCVCYICRSLPALSSPAEVAMAS